MAAAAAAAAAASKTLGWAARRVRLLSTAAVVARKSDPLRILFCGSDDFSCESLRALHREHLENPALIEAVDVLVRPGKKTARGLKQVRQVPCMMLARDLGLSVHERDTFRGWKLPEGTNLVVAVSFGLFVPPRIIKSTKYGGLNVHPSALPHLRGPAPVHHAILRGDKHIGLSLQTLDTNAFDHGIVLAQSPPPGLPVPPRATVKELTRSMAVAGADMLIRALRDGLHVPPLRQVSWIDEQPRRGDEEQPAHAPKVTKADARIDWTAWSPDDFERRLRVFDAIWTLGLLPDGTIKRILFTAEAQVVDKLPGGTRGSLGPTIAFVPDDPAADRKNGSGGGGGGDNGTHRCGEGFHTALRVDEASGCCHVELRDGLWVRFSKAKVDGKPERAAAEALKPFIRPAR